MQEAPDRTTNSEDDIVSESVATETDANQDSGTTDTQTELKPQPQVVQGNSSVEVLESDGNVTHNPNASARSIFNKLKLSNSPSSPKRRSRRSYSAHSRRSKSVQSPPRSPALKRTVPSPDTVSQMVKQARQESTKVQSSKFKNGNTNVS